MLLRQAAFNFLEIKDSILQIWIDMVTSTQKKSWPIYALQLSVTSSCLPIGCTLEVYPYSQDPLRLDRRIWWFSSAPHCILWYSEWNRNVDATPVNFASTEVKKFAVYLTDFTRRRNIIFGRRVRVHNFRKIQGSRFKVLGSRFKIQGSRFKIQDSRF